LDIFGVEENLLLLLATQIFQKLYLISKIRKSIIVLPSRSETPHFSVGSSHKNKKYERLLIVAKKE